MSDYNIFLSYSRKNEKIMERIRSEFEEAGLTSWTMQGIEPGAPSWKREVEQGFRKSDCVVCILTPEANESEWVRAELDFALALKKKIFLILADGDASTAVPFGFTTTQWIDIRPSESETEPNLLQLPRLIKILQAHVSTPPASSQHSVSSSPPKKDKTLSKTIFVSAPLDKVINVEERAVKRRILEMLVEQGFEPLLIGEAGAGLNMSWTFDGVIEVMADCVGAVILGLTRWELTDKDDNLYRFATEYTHFEGALALVNKLPTLIIKEDGVSERGIFYMGGGRLIITVPPVGAEKELHSDKFNLRFAAWRDAVLASK